MAEDPSSVSVWLGRLKTGDPAAARPLWNHYFERLVRLARGKLSGRARRVADEEDVALSAFHSFCQAAADGRFPQLHDRDDLWSLLVVMTERKVYAHIDRETAAKRGGGGVRGDSVFAAEDGGRNGLEPADPDPTPAFAAEVAEQCEALLDRLAAREPLLRDLAVWKLEGYTNDEIATKVGKSLATVERKFALIRALWAAGDPPAA